MRLITTAVFVGTLSAAALMTTSCQQTPRETVVTPVPADPVTSTEQSSSTVTKETVTPVPAVNPDGTPAPSTTERTTSERTKSVEKKRP